MFKVEGEKMTIGQVADWLSRLIGPDQVTELRALHVQHGRERPHTVSGFFDARNLSLMAERALSLSEKSRGVYFTLNPLREDILARCANRTAYGEEGKLAKDKDVIRRRWLLIDADAVRDPHISSTSAEKAEAARVIEAVRADLTKRGWPQPIFGDSGNGYHLFFAIDLPTDDGGLVARSLKALATAYDTPSVHIDQSVHNPARICKLPGTIARKGDSVALRPHRRAVLMEIPEQGVQVVPGELLEALAAQAPMPTVSPASNGFHAAKGGFRHRLLVERWLQDRGIAFRVKNQPDSRGRTVYVLQHCPFDRGHGDPDSCIMQSPDGSLSGHCFHASCAGRGWQEFKNSIGAPGPHHYDPPLAKPRRQRDARGPRSGGGPNAVASDGGIDEAEDDPHRLARGFLQRFFKDETLSLRYWRDEFHRWDGCAYRPVPDQEIRSELTQYIRSEFEKLYRERRQEYLARGPSGNGEKPPQPIRKVTMKLLADTLQALRASACLSFAVEPPAWLNGAAPFPASQALACANGILNVPAWAGSGAGLHPLTPRFFSPTALSYGFDADAAPADSWLRFLRSVWPHDPEAIAALQDWFGYCLLPDTSQQKILMFVGPKRSGKGTIARVLSRLVGLSNAASPTLGSLGSPFGLQPLLHKTLAIISDARLSHRTDAAVVTERLLSISGEDAQTIDRKYREPVTVRLPVRFVVLTNELPRLHDASGALVGRLVLLRLTRSFYGVEDTKLTAKLLRELPSILLWAVAGWKRLRDRGRFQMPESSAAIVQQLDDLASPVGAFVRDCCEIGAGFSTPCNHLFEKWKDWADIKGMKAGTEQTFGRDLRAGFPALETRRPRCEDGRYRVYQGIRLRSEAPAGDGLRTPFA